MKQAKYSLYAFLLLFIIVVTALLIDKLLPVQGSKQVSIVAIAKPSEKDTVIANTEGRILYEANCATCHGRYGRIDGLSLRNAETREPWTERRTLIRWIKNPATATNQFEYTKQLIEAYNGIMMPSFSQLSDEEIEAILDYLKELDEKKIF